MMRPSDRIPTPALATLWRHIAWLVVGVTLVFGPWAVRPADASRQQKGSTLAPAQPPSEAEPRQTIIAALEAACSQNAQEFSRYLLADSQRSFSALPEDQQKTLLKRFSLTSLPGHAQPFLDTKGQTVVRCSTPAETVLYRLDTPQVDHNVAFLPVTVSGGEKTNFGMVRQPGGWRLFSLGLLVINVPALVEQWEEAALQANERTAIADLVFIEQAIKSYHESFGRWPDSLEQLGPAPPNDVSPERAQLLSDRLASGTTDGYRFRYLVVTGTNGQIEGFELGAVPETYGKTGRRSFFLDAQGKLHAADKDGAPATDDDPLYTPQPEPSSQ
ncbi:MAG: hypothetical protein KGL59_06605 [Acidobacteriota bacterium]|nr:hypothetical protein [Acidobacteriota bacterium]